MSVSEHSFQFDGHDMFTQYGVIITRRPWPYMPSPRVWRQPLADAHGEITAGRTFDARIFNFDCSVEDNTGAIETTLENIVALFTAAHISGALVPVIFGYRPAEQFLCRVISGITFESGLNGAVFALSLLAPDPVSTQVEVDS